MALRVMLDIERIRVQFGDFVAVSDVSLHVEAGTITGLIGPNGAGKTTLFNTITGFCQPQAGQVRLAGHDITALPPHRLFAKGAVRTFQIAHEFSSLTVRENLMVVPAQQSGERIVQSWINRHRINREEAMLRTQADEIIGFLDLDPVADLPAGKLSGGQKKLLELGRTMMTRASLVFLDEIGAGVNRTLLKKIGDSIRHMNEHQGVTFFLIEHDMAFVSRLCHRVICMAEGRLLAEGSMDEIMANEDVIQAYLGAKSASDVEGS